MIEARSSMQAVGDWLFRGSQVYMLGEPDRILKTVRINWDAQTSDVQAEDGTMFWDVPWDRLDFADDVELHLPNEPN